MSDDALPSLDPRRTTVDIDVLLPDGTKTPIRVPLQDLFTAYLTIHELGYNNALGLINLAVEAGKEIRRVGAVPNAFEGVLHLLEDRRSPVDVDRKQRERQVLSFCYLLRTRMELSLTKTAQMAAGLLGERADTGYVEAFRKKLERYAEREGKPSPGKPRLKKHQ